MKRNKVLQGGAIVLKEDRVRKTTSRITRIQLCFRGKNSINIGNLLNYIQEKEQDLQQREDKLKQKLKEVAKREIEVRKLSWLFTLPVNFIRKPNDTPK